LDETSGSSGGGRLRAVFLDLPGKFFAASAVVILAISGTLVSFDAPVLGVIL